jgi:hypothetical protein
MKKSMRALACAILVGASLAPNLLAQATNPSYIAEFPSVDKVMAGEKAADPDTTAEQQIAAFTWLQNMIVQLAGPRQFISGPGGMTPDEQNLRQAYNTALYKIQQTNPAKYNAPGPAQQLKMSLAFRNQMMQQLFPPGFPAEWTKLLAQTNQQAAQLHQKALEASAAQQKAAQPAAQAAMNQLYQQVQQQQQEANMDPATREMRRCVTSGRVLAVCTGNGLMNSLMPNVNGLLNAAAPGVVGKEVTGPQMAGVFTGGDGWQLQFSGASVSLSCEGLNPDSHAYTVSFANNLATLDIASTPKDVVLSVNGNTLSGASAVTVNGRVYLGEHNGTTLQGQAANVYTYQQATRNCAKPSLTASSSPGVVGAEQNMLVSMFNDGDSGPQTPPGLRMNGSYATSTGFSVEFFPESVILGCGPDVARAYPYTLVADGKQAVIKVNAPDHPLMLGWKGNNTLDPGTGPYVVEGRTITGEAANGDYTFVPHNATCNLAALTPGPIPSTLPPQPAAR